MHWPTAEEEKLAADIGTWAMSRLSFRDDTFPPLHGSGPLPPIGATGIGAEQAWQVLRDRVLPTALPTDHPRYLAFVGGAPTVASVVADMAVSAAGVYAGSSLEGGAVVAAEGAAIRWLARLAGLPDSAFGTFVSGGSIANLSALVAARHAVRARRGRRPGLVVAGAGAHASVGSAAEIMGCDLVPAGDRDGRLEGHDLERVLATTPIEEIAAVVATAGATNTGAVDDLAGIARVCHRHGLWLHVDAAYGGAALLAERSRPLFRGLEAADSITIDPHKWLFTPFDCAAVLYREPEHARRAHTQTASYLDPVNTPGQENPSDYAVHLSRRARGIPLWSSLLANGTAAYTTAVERCLDLAGYAAERVAAKPSLEIAADPALSVVVFYRVGWTAAQYRAWSEHAARTGLALVTPTELGGATAFRLCFVNPVTTTADIDQILDSLG
ncbi:MAG TPA: aminotransferase class V-fold PLP-dependent enzyme [Jatrophihabitantaceae bacterium]|jgi:glutamate/tyrosine decarboxylase-like PLP-dependent enzyme